MSLLHNVLFAWKCSSTHHKMALDALRHLQTPEAERWRDLFLFHADVYLRGAKAPDTTFKDFRNHVLHVTENYWGGAAKTAQAWYEQTVAALRARNWPQGVYNAGVLSHYYHDPLMPLHTGQSVSEGGVHRACEWSITKSYKELRCILEVELDGYPNIEVPGGEDWLKQMVHSAAEAANPFYQVLLDHYNLDLGVKNPPAGLDQECKDGLARLIGHGIVGFARILDRTLADAGVTPPTVNLTLQTVLQTLSIPVRWVTNKMEDAKERTVVEAMYKELQDTGKVIANLPEDDKTVRAAHASEVLKISLKELDDHKPEPTGTKFGTGTLTRVRGQRLNSTPTVEPRHILPFTPKALPSKANDRLRYYLNTEMPLERSPSIGPKTSARFAEIGVNTVAEFLRLDPESAERQLDVRHIKADTIRLWQTQARLMCQVPNLRVHDVQILVGGGITDAGQLSASTPEDVLARIKPFLETREGQWTIRSGKRPDHEEVTDWISWAKQSRRLAA